MCLVSGGDARGARPHRRDASEGIHAQTMTSEPSERCATRIQLCWDNKGSIILCASVIQTQRKVSCEKLTEFGRTSKVTGSSMCTEVKHES